MPRKPSKTTLNNNLDKTFSLVIRSVGFCEFCGRTQNLQCAHIASRRHKRIRWSLSNALCLCAGCHRRGHDLPLEFAARVKRDFPHRYAFATNPENLKPITRSVPELQDLLAELKTELEEKRAA